MAGFSTLTAEWVDGALVIYDSAHTAVVTLNSSGLNWVGGVTISSAILVAAPTLSTANLSTSTLSVADISTATMSVATISTATVTTSYFNACTISTGTMSTSALSVCTISTSTITTSTFSGGSISTGTMTTSALSVCTISTSTITTSVLSGSSISTSTISVGSLSACVISTGTITSAVLSACDISTGNFTGGATISSGLVVNEDFTISTGVFSYYGQKTKNITVDTTLTVSGSGTVHYATVCDVIITLPGVASSGVALMYTIVCTNTGTAQVVVKTTTTELIKGTAAVSTGVDILANTGATHKKGDMIVLLGNPASTSWSMMGMVGTWASTT